MTHQLPFCTSELGGTGGIIKTCPEDFIVDEIPLYEPCGEGQHLYIRFRKTGLTTRQVVTKVARQLGIKPERIGTAGLKDKDAVTSQWMSVPVHMMGDVDPKSFEEQRLEILECKKHNNKLKVGHLIGNRFKIRIRFCNPGALDRAGEIISRIMDRGMVNFYGEQRFGVEGNNIYEGRDIILGKLKKDNPFLRRLFMSSYQSHLFNGYAFARLKAGLAWKVMKGDVLKKVDTGGMFVCSEPDTDQKRFDNREIVQTGPMIGFKMKQPEDESADFEQSILQGMNYNEEVAQGCLKRKIMGTRRPLLVYPWDMSFHEDEAGLVINFSLPKGSFATVFIREITKPDQGFGHLEFSDLESDGF
jgi:tRNA pseudouridine13 synthase